MGAAALVPDTPEKPPAAAAADRSRKVPAKGAGKTATAGAGVGGDRTGRSSSEQWSLALLELGKAFRGTFRNLSRLRGRDTHLGGSELSHAQFELLIELYERGELSAGELACAAQLAPATVTQMLEHLAESGHVERTRSEQDKRVVVTRLTRQGNRKIEAKRAAWRDRWEEALADVDARELRVAARVLERLGAIFAEQGDGDCQ